MAVINLNHSSGVCQILIEGGLADRVGEAAAKFLKTPSQTVVVTDRNVAKCALSRVKKSLERAGFKVGTAILPPGEKEKSLSNLKRLYDVFLKIKLDRWSPVFALGGGVICDLTGFAASTFMRGIPSFYIPTTLLAQVDASIGGKTAVNLSQGKNLVGAFYQPKAIFTDQLLLKTLPDREIRAGLGEIIKFGMIKDDAFFSFLQKNVSNVLERDRATLETIIYRTASLKVSIVEGDEKEQGKRAILNYGHTIGHAIETLTSYGRFRHGEAVAVGMECEAMMAVEMGLASGKLFSSQHELLDEAGLPTTVKGLSPKEILSFISSDKKAKGGKPRFVLPEVIGKVVFPVTVPDRVISRAVKYVCK